MSFSKDDSLGSLGKTRCQVNLYNPSNSYTITVVAKNSQGTASDSLTLTWGCEEETGTDTEDEESIIRGWGLELGSGKNYYRYVPQFG